MQLMRRIVGFEELRRQINSSFVLTLIALNRNEVCRLAARQPKQLKRLKRTRYFPSSTISNDYTVSGRQRARDNNSGSWATAKYAAERLVRLVLSFEMEICLPTKKN